MTYIKILIVFSSLLILHSCKTDTTDLDRYFSESRSVLPKPIEPLPEINSPEIFLYVAHELRDPFSNDLEVLDDFNPENPQEITGPGPDFDRRKEILENYPLDALYMVGTFIQEDDYWGLIEDPEGVIHRVSMNEHLGQNHGQIVAVNEDRIDVSEWVSDGLGGWTKRKASIALREE